MSRHDRRAALDAQRALHNVRALPVGDWLNAVREQDNDLAEHLARRQEDLHVCQTVVARARDECFDAESRQCEQRLTARLIDPTFNRRLIFVNDRLRERLCRLDARGLGDRAAQKTLQRDASPRASDTQANSSRPVGKHRPGHMERAPRCSSATTAAAVARVPEPRIRKAAPAVVAASLVRATTGNRASRRVLSS